MNPSVQVSHDVTCDCNLNIRDGLWAIWLSVCRMEANSCMNNFYLDEVTIDSFDLFSSLVNFGCVNVMMSHDIREERLSEHCVK